jgi:flagellar motility protein MotE (MotC chaperone)
MKASWIVALCLTVGGTALSLWGGDEAGAEESSFGKDAPEAKAAAEKGGDKAKGENGNGKHHDSPPPIAAIRDPQAPGACLVDSAAIEDIRKRREELDARAKELAARETELAAKERALGEELRKLEVVRDEIGRAEGTQKAQNEEKIAKLVETFQSMSPKAAAGVLASVDEGLAVAAMERIETPRLAKIMNVMEPGRVSRLTELLAGIIKARKSQSAKGGEKSNGQSEHEREQEQSGAVARSPAGASGGSEGQGGNEGGQKSR